MTMEILKQAGQTITSISNSSNIQSTSAQLIREAATPAKTIYQALTEPSPYSPFATAAELEILKTAFPGSNQAQDQLSVLEEIRKSINELKAYSLEDLELRDDLNADIEYFKQKIEKSFKLSPEMLDDEPRDFGAAVVEATVEAAGPQSIEDVVLPLMHQALDILSDFDRMTQESIAFAKSQLSAEQISSITEHHDMYSVPYLKDGDYVSDFLGLCLCDNCVASRKRLNDARALGHKDWDSL